MDNGEKAKRRSANSDRKSMESDLQESTPVSIPFVFGGEFVVLFIALWVVVCYCEVRFIAIGDPAQSKHLKERHSIYINRYIWNDSNV